VLVGVVLYFIERIPMDPTILLLIRVVIVVCVIFYLVNLFGFADLPLPRYHR
jgi:hypothetical protein